MFNCAVFSGGNLVAQDFQQFHLSKMDKKAFKKLEYYSLVSKVCTELKNHLNLEDKVLGTCAFLSYFAAEFVIHLAKKNDNFDCFKNALVENGAVFSVSCLCSVCYSR